MLLKNNFARIARGRAKAGGILVVFSRALCAAVHADMHITPKGCDNEALADNLSILFTTAAPALTVIDSAVGGYARIPRSEATCSRRPSGPRCALSWRVHRDSRTSTDGAWPRPQNDPDLDSMRVQIAKVNQTISRLIDGYTEGLIDKDEFTLWIRRVRRTARRTSKGNCNPTPI